MASTTRPPGRLQRLAALAAGLALLALVGCASDPAPEAPPKPVQVAGSVVSTAGSSNEADVVVPTEVQAAWTGLGGQGKGLEWVKVAGDGTAATEPVDLTGDATAAGTKLAEQMNGFDAEQPGRQALAGLDALASPAGSPVWVFSPLLDTRGPLDFNQLAFDESPVAVVKAMKAAGTLPDLKGRQVTYVVTPEAGEQEKLPQLKVGYQHAVWEGVAKAAGAKKVTFFNGTGSTAGSGTIPAVPVPDPSDKLASEQSGNRRVCTLPAPALFVADQPTLIDKQATLKALKACVGKLEASTKITVEGHTAGSSGANNAFAKKLSTQRATEVAALLKELDVPAGNITKVVGYGSEQPLVEPPTDPRNRAVVVTFTSSG